MGNVGAIPGMLNPAVQNTDFLREQRVDQMLEMWRTAGFARPSHIEVTWENGDTAALHSADRGFTIVATIKGTSNAEEG